MGVGNVIWKIKINVRAFVCNFFFSMSALKLDNLSIPQMSLWGESDIIFEEKI